MKRKIAFSIISLAVAGALALTGCAVKEKTVSALNDGGKLANVNGVELYYTVQGSGKPILLIHGNGENHTIFNKLAQKLKENHTVYCVDSRDHGNSTKTDTLSYDDIAKDFSEFIKTVIGEKTTVYGFSDGGIVGLLLAINYPENLDKLIISGANTRPETLKWYVRAGFKIQYTLSKDEKIRMMFTEPNITQDELESINIPCVVIAGEKDIIMRSDTDFIAQSIPNSKEEIVLGEGHGSYIANGNKIYKIISKYL